MKTGFWEILLIIILVLVLFGHSKIPDVMKNLANGINIFKKELKKEVAPSKTKSANSVEKSVVKKPKAKPKKKATSKKK